MMKHLCTGPEKLLGAGAGLAGATTPPVPPTFVGWRSLRIPQAAAHGLIAATLAAMSAPLGAQAQGTADIRPRNEQAGHHRNARTGHAYGRWTAAEAAAIKPKTPMHAGIGDRKLSDLGRGRYDKAISLLRQKLEARERTLGTDDPYTLTTINSLALLYKAQGSYREAEPLYKRALEASERALGREHPFTVATANSLASLYEAQGRRGEAEQLYKRALAAKGWAPGN